MIAARKSLIGVAVAGVITVAAGLTALVPAFIAKAFVEIETAVFHEICDFVRFDARGTDFVIAITQHFDGELGDQVDS